MTAPGARKLDAADHALLARTPAREIWAWLVLRYPGKTLSFDLSPQLDLAIDSLEWVTMTLEMAERFDVHFTEDDGAQIMTLGDLLRRAGERQSAGSRAPAREAELSPAQLALIAEPGWARRLLGLVLYIVNRCLIRAAFGLDVAGVANIPAHGPFVIACNHLSDLDPFTIAAGLPRRDLARIWWSGDGGRVFGHGVLRRFARIARIFPVDERQPATTLAYGRTVLARGQGLIWFPEAWRSPDGALQKFMPGLGQILARLPAPVVPARLAGTFDALPRGACWPRRMRLRLVLGTPLNPATIELNAAAITAALRARIAELAGA